jgi:sugar phosphate isomerase/epimerase
MLPLRWAAASRCWNANWDTVLKGAVALRLDGLQLDVREELPPSALTETGRRDFLHRLRERGLQVASTWLPLKHPLYAEREQEGRIAFVRAAMTFTATLQSKLLCLRIGRIPEAADDPQGQTLREIVSDLAAFGNHIGVTLAITPTAESVETLQTFLRQIKTGPIGVDFDPAYFAMAGEPTADSLRKLHADVLHVQLRDGLRDFVGGGQEAAVGRGTVDWAELLALLGEMDYRGWLTAIRTQGDDKPGDLARGVKHLQRLLLGG